MSRTQSPETERNPAFHATTAAARRPAGSAKRALIVTEGLPRRPIIGTVLPGSNPVELFLAVADGLPDYEFLAYVPSLGIHQETWFKKKRIRYTDDLCFFLMQATSLQAVLTFGALPHTAHMRVLIAVSLLREIAVPVIDIQHGLFQWGINFTDSSLQQGFGQDAGISLVLNAVADEQVTWAGKQAIGYPRFTQTVKATPPSPHAPILIATNSNWHIYSQEDRIRLQRILQRLFLDFTCVNFVWKPHPAEFNATLTSLKSLIDRVMQERKLFGHVQLARPVSEGGRTLTELIATCRAGIATVGTALIDFELYQRPCVVYDCAAVQDINTHMPRVDRFTTYEDLVERLVQLNESGTAPVTGQLKPFEPQALRDILTVRMTSSRRQQGDALPAVLRHLVLAKQLI